MLDFDFQIVTQVFSEELEKAEKAFADLNKKTKLLKEIKEKEKQLKNLESIENSLAYLLETKALPLIGKGVDIPKLKDTIKNLRQELAELQKQQEESIKARASEDTQLLGVARSYGKSLQDERAKYAKMQQVTDYINLKNVLGARIEGKTDEEINDDEQIQKIKRDLNRRAEDESVKNYLIADQKLKLWGNKSPEDKNVEAIKLEEEKSEPAVRKQNEETIAQAKKALAEMRIAVKSAPAIDKEVAQKKESELNEFEKQLQAASEAVKYTPNKNTDLVNLWATIGAASKRSWDELKKTDMWSQHADKTENGLINNLSRIQTSKGATDEQKEKAKEIEGRLKSIQDMPDAKNRYREYSKLAGELDSDVLVVQQLDKDMADKAVSKLNQKEYLDNLAGMSISERIGDLLSRDPAELKKMKLSPSEEVRKNLEKVYGKGTAETFVQDIYDKKMDKGAVMRVIGNLDKAKAQLDEDPKWKGREAEKQAILFEVASNPAFANKIVGDYLAADPEKLGSDYFAKKSKLIQSRLDLKSLQAEYDKTVRGTGEKGLPSETAKDIAEQITKKKEEIASNEKNLIGDVSKLNEVGARYKNIGTEIDELKAKLASPQKKSLPEIGAMKSKLVVLEEEKRRLTSQIKPLVEDAVKVQEGLPPAERNEFVNLYNKDKAKKEEERKAYQSEQNKEYVRQRADDVKAELKKQGLTFKPELEANFRKLPKEQADLFLEKTQNMPDVKKLKEGELSRIKEEPQFIQDRIQAKLASAGNFLSTSEFQQLQKDLAEIRKERIPVAQAPTKDEEVAQTQKPEESPELKTPDVGKLPEMKAPQIEVAGTLEEREELAKKKEMEEDKQLAIQKAQEEERQQGYGFELAAQATQQLQQNLEGSQQVSQNEAELVQQELAKREELATKLPMLFEEQTRLVEEAKTADQVRLAEINKRLQELQSEINKIQEA